MDYLFKIFLYELKRPIKKYWCSTCFVAVFSVNLYFFLMIIIKITLIRFLLHFSMMYHIIEIYTKEIKKQTNMYLYNIILFPKSEQFCYACDIIVTSLSLKLRWLFWKPTRNDTYINSQNMWQSLQHIRTTPLLLISPITVFAHLQLENITF